MEIPILTTLSIEEFRAVIREELAKALQEHLKVPEIEEKGHLTRKEVSSRYKISLGTIHNLMQKGLPYIKVGRKTLFNIKEIEIYFKDLESSTYSKN